MSAARASSSGVVLSVIAIGAGMLLFAEEALVDFVASGV